MRGSGVGCGGGSFQSALLRDSASNLPLLPGSFERVERPYGSRSRNTPPSREEEFRSPACEPGCRVSRQS